MLSWLAANAATIAICIVLAALFALAIRYVFKKTKKGECAGCSYSDTCSHSCGGNCCSQDEKDQ